MTTESVNFTSTPASQMDWVHERLEAANSSGQTEREALANLYFWTFGVFLSIICSIGIITNILNIYALAVTLATKKRPMYYFLLTMAAADLGIMAILLVRSARLFIAKPRLIFSSNIYNSSGDILVDYPTYFFYKTWYIPTNILMTISNWCTVSMGVFRLIAVLTPLRSSYLCTIKRVKLTLTAVCIFSLLINLPSILELKLEGRMFHIKKTISKYNTLSLIFTCPVPTMTVLIINIILLSKLRLHRNKMGRMFGSSRQASGSSRSHQLEQLKRAAKGNRAGATVLIAVSIFYVIMSTPNVIYFIVSYTMDSWQDVSIISRIVFYIVASLFIYVNHACNFFFYVVLNQPFRALLWKKVRHVHSRSPSTQFSDYTGGTAGNSLNMALIRGERTDRSCPPGSGTKDPEAQIQTVL